MKIYMIKEYGTEAEELEGVKVLSVRADDGQWVGRFYEARSMFWDDIHGERACVGVEVTGVCIAGIRGQVFMGEPPPAGSEPK